MSIYNRRNFLKTSVIGGIAATCIRPFEAFASIGKMNQLSSRVALTTGDNRADMAFRALKPFSKQIAQAIGNEELFLNQIMYQSIFLSVLPMPIHWKGYWNS